MVENEALPIKQIAINEGSPAFAQYGITTGNPEKFRHNIKIIKQFPSTFGSRHSLQVVESDFARNMADLQSQELMKHGDFPMGFNWTLNCCRTEMLRKPTKN